MSFTKDNKIDEFNKNNDVTIISQCKSNLSVIKLPFCAIVKDVKEKGSYFYCYARVSAYLLIYLKKKIIPI